MSGHRSQVNTAKDSKYFASTAQKTKLINVKPRISRGGIRL